MTTLDRPTFTDDAGSFTLTAYKPRGACEELFYCTEDAILLEGPAGTGKSRAALEKVKYCCIAYPNLRVLMVRKTRASLSETILPIWEAKVLPPDMITGNAKRAHRDKYEMPRGSEVILGGMDNPDRVLSAEYDLIVVFQAEELTEDDYETLTTRIGRDYRADGFDRQIICDCNPGPPEHFLNLKAKNGEMVRLKSLHTNNPHLYDDDGNLTEVGADYIDRLKRLSGHRYQRYFLGNWAAAEGLVYEDFNPDIHLIDKHDTPYSHFLAGVDWGYVDAGVMQVWGIDLNSRSVLECEVYRSGKDIDFWKKIADNIHRKYRPKRWLCDHRPDFIGQLIRMGIPATKAMKDIQHGIQVVQARLALQADGKPYIYIKKDARKFVDRELKKKGKPTNTAAEFWSYVYPKPEKRLVKHEIPVDDNNHGMDTMRYVQVYHDKYYSLDIFDRKLAV